MHFMPRHARPLIISALPFLALTACDSPVEEPAEAAPAETPLVGGPNGGYSFRLVDPAGEGIGTVEIKLHDDKGDLEVWLNKGGKPWDLALDSQLTVAFPDLEKKVMLAVRDQETNADENGESMIREGRTNYFIFPGDTGEDASWLQGHHFAETAVLTFKAGGAEARTEPVVLKPHGHHGDHDHEHGHDHDHPHPH